MAFSRRCRSSSILLLACLLGLIAGCAGDAGELGSGRETVVRRDSAGLEIVEVGPAVLQGLPVWRLADEPSLSIGVLGGEKPYLLSDVRAAVLLEEGGVLVSEGFPRETGDLRVFDSEGRFVRTIARYGEGPAEFTYPRTIVPGPEDTLYIWDRELQRLTTLTTRGSLVEQISTMRSCPQRTCSHPGGILDDGTLVMSSGASRSSEGNSGTIVGGTIDLGLIRDGRWTAITEMRQGNQFFASSSRFPGAIYIFPEMFGGVPRWSAAVDLIAEARTDSSDIRLRAPDGTLVRILRLTGEPRPVTEAEVAAYRSHDWGTEDRAAAAEDWLARSEPAEHVPHFDDLLVDGSGRLWVRDYGAWSLTDGGSPRWWTVFDEDGTPLARIELPGPDSLAVLHIEGNAVLGRITGELDVPSVVVRPIERGDGR